MKRVMVLNLGSTSFKFKLFEFDQTEAELASGEVDNIGGKNSSFNLCVRNGTEKGTFCCIHHGTAFQLCIDLLKKHHIFDSMKDLDAVGYKAVHGGPVSGVQRVDDKLLGIIDEYASFAPAHNPIYSQMMRQLQKQSPQLCQVAYFETSFHSSIPEYRAVYGVPYEWKEQYGIKRYGFHGSSHSYIAEKMRTEAPEAKRIISAHLGGSSSLCAIKDGKSIATSMGATPQSGVFHNNRVGDLDVFCMPALMKHHQDDFSAVIKELSTQSGFLGLSGISNDLRVILQARDVGDKRADLAVMAFVDSIVGYIGMYTAFLGGLQALVFAGGIGRRSAIVRKMVCERLGFLSVMIDNDKNQNSCEGKISTEESGIGVWVFDTNEELMVARKTTEYLYRVRNNDF